MAVPAYATDLVDITTSFTIDWNLISEGGGGQNALTAPETDDFIQGTESVSRNPFSSSIRGVAYDRATITVGADDAVFHWWKADVAAALGTFAGGGVHLIQGTSLTVYKKFYVAGNDTYQLGGWRCTPIDPTASPSASRGTEPSPDFNTFGAAFDVTATGPSKGFPFKHDMIRHGRQVEVTAGEIANPATWTLLSDYADVASRRWGIVQGTPSGPSVQGIVEWGTATTAVYSRDSNKTITLLDTLGFTITKFTQIQFNHASNDIVWDNIGLVSLDPLNKGCIVVGADGSITWTNSVFQDIDTTDLLADSTFDGSSWVGTNEITAAGASILRGQVLAPTVALNTSALIWDVATDPDGLLDDMTFTKGAADHHAIEFGTNIPSEITINGADFTGFSASQDVNSSVFHFKDTGGTITINLVGCTSDVALSTSYRTDGATIIVVEDPVVTTVTTLTEDGTIVTGVRVIVEAKDGTGTLPFEESISIARSGTTATVTHTGHGIPDGKYVVIRGATEQRYNKVAVITWISANSYSYQVSGSPSQPATGSPIATGVMVYGSTNGSGEVSDSRTLSSAQPVVGRTLKSTTGPYYKTGRVNGSVSAASGANFTALMVLDQ
jgi:hypothetical protein